MHAYYWPGISTSSHCSAMEVELSPLLCQIETLNKRPSEEVLGVLRPSAAKELRRSLNRLCVALESSVDIIDHIMNSISLFRREAYNSL